MTSFDLRCPFSPGGFDVRRRCGREDGHDGPHRLPSGFEWSVPGSYTRHESPDYADGGVAAAQTEKETEQDTVSYWIAQYENAVEFANTETEHALKAERDRDEALYQRDQWMRGSDSLSGTLGEAVQERGRIARALGLRPDATADEMVARIEERPGPDDITDEMVERGESYMKSRPWTVSGLLRDVLTEPPSRPDGLTRLIDTIREATYDPEPEATGEALYNAGVRAPEEVTVEVDPGPAAEGRSHERVRPVRARLVPSHAPRWNVRQEVREVREGAGPMKTIWKFELLVQDHAEVQMPRGAEVLSVHPTSTPAFLHLWAIVDPQAPKELRRFEVRGTGHPLDEVGPYVGTVVAGMLVWHVFEAVEQS